MAKLNAMLLLNFLVFGQDGSRDLKDQGCKPPTGGEVRIPNRTTQPLFQGKLGNEKTDIRSKTSIRLDTPESLRHGSGSSIFLLPNRNFLQLARRMFGKTERGNLC